MTEMQLSSADRKAIVKLLRFAGDAPLEMAAADDGAAEVNLRKAGGEGRRVAASVLRHAAALGLVVRDRTRLQASPEARGFLRRALSEAGGDPFAEQHRDMTQTVVEIDGIRARAQVNRSESPLSALSRIRDRQGQPFLPAAALEAGERLLADFTRGQLQPRITASWEPRLSSSVRGRSGGTADLADAAMAARHRVGRAVEAMGPELSGVALDVCCFMKGLELVERERQWPARSAKLLLRAALLALARHYQPETPPRRSSIGHWGTADFRPDL